jgi:hypothetical protein
MATGKLTLNGRENLFMGAVGGVMETGIQMPLITYKICVQVRCCSYPPRAQLIQLILPHVFTRAPQRVGSNLGGRKQQSVPFPAATR